MDSSHSAEGMGDDTGERVGEGTGEGTGEGIDGSTGERVGDDVGTGRGIGDSTGARSGPRRRDRHGRGMRGPVAPPQVPLSVSRSETFRDLVLDSVERLERRWPQLQEVEFLVTDVPFKATPGAGSDDGDSAAWSDEAVPLGRAVAAGKDRPARILVYRRPVEIRTKSRDERALLVHEVVVEQVAELLGLAPESVDPRYGQD